MLVPRMLLLQRLRVMRRMRRRITMVGGCIDRRQLENHFHICGIDQRRQQIQSIAYRSAEADDDGGGWLRRRRGGRLRRRRGGGWMKIMIAEKNWEDSCKGGEGG